MKIKERALSLLLSLVMVLTFMPALAFAEEVDEPADVDGIPAVEESAEILEKAAEEKGAEGAAFDSLEDVVVNRGGADDSEAATLTYNNGDTTMEVEYGHYPSFIEDEDVITITIDETAYSYSYSYDYQQDKEVWTYMGEGNDPLGINYISINCPENIDTFKAGTTFTYTVCASIGDDTFIESGAYNGVIIPRQEGFVAPFYFVVNNDGTATLSDCDYDEVKELTSITIPANVNLGDGIIHTVSAIREWTFYDLTKCQSVTVPATVTTIGNNALGFYWDEAAGLDAKIPGFTIFGTNGSSAQTYANNNGFIFRDLAAEAAAAAEAARQGTPGNLPKVKASKPKAAKKAITVKWKKLKKKQLKSGVSNIEVWVCSDGAFANGSTIERVVGKKKSSLKIKGLQKGVTYYVKVRAITYSGGTKIVGPWSAVKKVKVKK